MADPKRVSFRSPVESPRPATGAAATSIGEPVVQAASSTPRSDEAARKASQSPTAGSMRSGSPSASGANSRSGSSRSKSKSSKGSSSSISGMPVVSPMHVTGAPPPPSSAAGLRLRTAGGAEGNGDAGYYRGLLATPPPQSSAVLAMEDEESGRAPLDGVSGTNKAGGLSKEEVAFMEMSMAARLGEGMKRKSPKHNATVPLGAEAELGLPEYTETRPTRRISHYTETGVLLIIGVAMGLAAYRMTSKTLVDGQWIRMVNVAWIPAIIIFMLFSVHFALNQIVCSFGPVAHMQSNSKYFSAVAPPRPLHNPMITIQMPVYKEGLEATIMPSIVSLEAAMTHYRKAGGLARIYINDDGLQLLTEKEQRDRIRCYEAHGIGYVARPPHAVKERKGLFKKASNMNYCLDITVRVETLMAENGVTDPSEALAMVKTSLNDEFMCGGDVRVGEIILLVDSDTRVPEDCLTKIVGEFALSPQLGFLQCRTTPLRDQDNYWEDMISHFTANIYDVGIALSVSAGDPAPLVGHNAFLRWAAIKAGSWMDEKDAQRKFWSEKHVSEDFDMSLRLQTLGYIGRYCTYTGPGFQEGVSLTVADEVIRLRKYAFGACEMLLNRFKDWPCKGPITGMFWSYLLTPSVPWPAKLQMTGYLGTYLAMGYSIYGLSTYILLRMFFPLLQEDTTNTFDVFMTVLILFGLIGMFGAGVIRYRMGYSSGMTIFQSWFIEIKNAPAMTIFWSSVMWHITTACWSYFWNRPIVWGATLKEVDNKSFYEEVKLTLQRYKSMYFGLSLLTLVFCGLMYYMKMPWGDLRLTFPFGCYVGFHAFGPFLLNPNILRGYY